MKYINIFHSPTGSLRVAAYPTKEFIPNEEIDQPEYVVDIHPEVMYYTLKQIINKIVDKTRVL